eukprot:Hpha_TRINITY_DN8982_c0_g1::TRINITY_DN8982_c0_g1_i1::g.80886::m.80886
MSKREESKREEQLPPTSPGGTHHQKSSGPKPGAIVHGRYLLGRKIGSGSFGDVHQGKDLVLGWTVAIKLESPSIRNSQLQHEAETYRELHREGTLQGFPRLHWLGREWNQLVMVSDLLGPSLEELLLYCGGRMSMPTVLLIADQMISRVESMHRRGMLHRDIKPQNFLLGVGERAHVVYLIDLGLSKRYLTENGKHVPFRDGKNLTGTARYASVNAHRGFEQARRDDLEAVAYVMLYCLKGNLPWQNLKAATKRQRYERIGEVKQTISPANLCRDWKGEALPEEIATYVKYCRKLDFTQQPDYGYLRGLLRGLYGKIAGPTPDYAYDWVKTDGSRSAESER